MYLLLVPVCTNYFKYYTKNLFARKGIIINKNTKKIK